MLMPRVIPCLLVHNKGLVKTVGFSNAKYIGDPINVVRIFNEKEADELMILDIDASVKGGEPDFKLIERLAAECRMPLSYGGGIKSVQHARTLIGLGVEKIAVSSALVENSDLATQMASEIGTQSVVAVLDVKKKRFSKHYEVWTHNATKNSKFCPVEFSKILQEKGVGEIVLNSIDRDGVMAGYDFELIARVRKEITLPMTVLGGAGKLSDLSDLFKCFGVIGAAAGSLFVFKGVYKAVLVNYPTPEIKDGLFSASF